MCADKTIEPNSPNRGFDNSEQTSIAIKSIARPWVTILAIVACLGVFCALGRQPGFESWESFGGFIYLPAISIWEGAFWVPVTSVFVHIELWHIALNLYWLWVLGSRMERAIGSSRFLVFFVLSGFVSSTFELAASDDVGFGASGVVYAIFGFMWFTRRRYPSFTEVLNERIVNAFLFWLGACVVATYLELYNIGNAAHFSGLLFGSMVACCFVLRYKPRFVLSGLVALVAFSVVPLFWCPWSVRWVAFKAYSEHVAGRYEAALGWYDQVIDRSPDDAWAHLGRSYVHGELGDAEEAKADLQKARELDPSIEDQE